MRSLRKTERGVEKRYKCARRQKNAEWARSRQKPIINSVTSRCSTRQLLLLFYSPLFIRSLLCPLSPRPFIFALINLPRDRFNRRASTFFAKKKEKNRLRCIEIEERLQFSIKLQDTLDKYDYLKNAENRNTNDKKRIFFTIRTKE